MNADSVSPWSNNPGIAGVSCTPYSLVHNPQFVICRNLCLPTFPHDFWERKSTMLKMAKVSSLLGFWAVQMASYALAHQTNFDFIIVGGGTSGLVVANRLSELSNVSVAIIEAGDDVRDNVNVTDANAFSAAFGTPIDWAYSSTAQEFAEDRVFPYHAGKAIGGTSTINGEHH